MIYIVLGVSGVGKTTIGKTLASFLNVPFYDADDYHPDTNISKMSNGIALDDSDRWPWLQNLTVLMSDWNKNGGAVLACSALKEKYRSILSSQLGEQVQFILLHAEMDVIQQRLNKRTNHYMKSDLLQSQFETLEIPNYGIRIDACGPKELIVKQIMNAIKENAEMGVIGLGVMGKSLAINLARNKVDLSVYNRQVAEKEVDVAARFVQENDHLAIKGFDILEQFVNSLAKPRNILLMVNAGRAVDLVINELRPFLDEDDLIIDGGNSYFEDSQRRAAELQKENIHFMGMGVSGGEEGALKGPSIMPGGSVEAYTRVAPILNIIAAKDKNDSPCCTYVGRGGSGHFVKMIHNGVEYAEMQLIAEVYHFLRFYQGYDPDQIARLFKEWSLAGLDSFLLQITIDILRTKEDDKYLIDLILDKAGQKGTGGWSTNAALALGKPLDTISQAVMARCLSAMKGRRVKASILYDDQAISAVKLNVDKLKQAYQASRIINHAIGFDAMQAASNEYDWQLNLSEIARIWTNGCIIRSGLMETLVDVLHHETEHLLLEPQMVSQLQLRQPAMQETVANMMQAGSPTPVMSAAINYFLGFVSAQSSANIIQAQRDYFGAHTFQRKDAPMDQFFHHNWNDMTG